MKLFVKGALVAILALSMTACSLINDDDQPFNVFDTKMDESVHYDKSVKGFSQIELEMDITVSDVEVISTNGTDIVFDQEANLKELLATAKYEEHGDTLKVIYSNKDSYKLKAQSQNSKITIKIPEEIKIKIDSNLNVGDYKIDANKLVLTEVNLETNVGDTTLSSNADQSSLSYIKMSSDVGDLFLDIENAESLDTVKMDTNTGEIRSYFDGNYEQRLELAADTDVGDMHLSFKGDFKEAVNLDLDANVGDIKLELPKGHEMVFDIKSPEFTSSLDWANIEYSKSRDQYKVDGDESQINIKINLNVGDGKFSYSN